MNLTETIISVHIIYQTLVLEFYTKGQLNSFFLNLTDLYEDHRSCNGYYSMSVGLGCPAISTCSDLVEIY